MDEVIIGIDLGTTNSEVAILKDGTVTVIADSQGNKILPSVVGLDENQALLVGRVAKNQQVLYPEKTIASIKRKMGSADLVSLGDQDYSPPEISAMILKQLKTQAEVYLGHPVTKAVITVPAYFSDQQRQATCEAGHLAGLEVSRIINEPTAAALAYQVDHEGERTVLVYDLGGGTFDVSVVSLAQGIVEVIASHGNNHLGGDDFDQKLVDHIIAHLSETQKVDATTCSQAMARIKQIAEKTKIHLSDHPYCQIDEPYLMDFNGEKIHLTLEITREDYEKMIESLINDTIDAVHIALREADLTVQEIDHVLLVGGSTQTPLIESALTNVFNKPPHGEIHPDLCVAMGAAIQAGTISGEKTTTVLVDVTPYTFGTSAIGFLHGQISSHTYVPIIKKNTPIPVTKSELFSTSHDYQEAVDIDVFQGDEEDARDNNKIGNFRISGLKMMRDMNQIVAKFHIDVNGILRVSAEEKLTGKSKSITIKNAMHSDSAEELTKSKKKIENLFPEKSLDSARTIDNDDAELLNEATEVIEKAESLLKTVSENDQVDLIDLIESLKDYVQTKEISRVTQALDELKDLVYYLESSLE